MGGGLARACLLIVACGAALSCSQPCPLGKGQCQAPPRSTVASFVGVERAFGGLSLEKPVLLTHAGDGSGRLFVVEQTGRIKAFDGADDAVTQAEVVLDLSGRVAGTTGEGGLLGLAFHPDFARNGQLFVSYTTGGPFRSVVSRWQMQDGRVDPQSERILLEVRQPYGNHNGGHLAFGPDGMLYIGLGDGGSRNDPHGHGQNLQTLLGSILRLDVNLGADEAPFHTIPADNPLVGRGDGARGEIWAWGLRNPWRFSFDAATGALYVGDVGQNAVEEISVAESGSNLGWKIQEGSTCFQSDSCDTQGLKQPLLQYPHTTGRSITGGQVYRGQRVPSLYGAYVYADFEASAVFVHQLGQEGSEVRKLLDAPSPPASFGEDEGGELYMVGYGGSLWRFVATAEPAGPDLPERLSQTGLFADLQTLTPAQGVEPFEVMYPFWSDGARKSRFFRLPEGQTLRIDAEGKMVVPKGTWAVKHFELEGPGGQHQRLETRVLVVGDDGLVAGATYRWEADGSDAILQLSGASRAVERAAGEGFEWIFPSSNQCRSCHSEAAGGLLALRTAQTNTFVAGGDQLQQWVERGLLDKPAQALVELESLPDELDSDDDSTDHARGYLDVNCAPCHQPGSSSGVGLDLRRQTPLANTGLCLEPKRGGLDLQNPRVVAPGDPARSVLLARLGAAPELRMPPLGAATEDSKGIETLRYWIERLERCP